MSHHEAHQCPSSCPHGKGAIVITITGCKGTCNKKHESTMDEKDEKEEKHHSPELVESKLVGTDSVISEGDETETLGGSSEEPKFVLPLLVERHHGPGCAMEINVMEKHDDSCLYKKQPTPGRSLEDRVGSYECIGRIVFRTCANDEESEKKPDIARGSGDKTPIRTPSLLVTGATQTSLSGKRESSDEGSKYASATSVAEKAPEGQNQQQLQFLRGKNPRVERVMYVQSKVANPKASFSKLFGPSAAKKISSGSVSRSSTEETRHPIPRNPVWMVPGHFDNKLYTSKKIFPVYADGGIQTDKQLRGSDETITTLNDLSKAPAKNKKSGLFGSVFRGKKSAVKTDQKKVKKH